MKENDMALDVDALTMTDGKLKRRMESINDFARQLCVNMNVAGKEFDSANFERAEEVVRDVMVKLSRRYLKDVEQKVEIYLKYKYIGW